MDNRNDEEFLGLKYSRIGEIFDDLQSIFIEYFNTYSGEFVFEVEEWLRENWINSLYVKPSLSIDSESIKINKEITDILLLEKTTDYKDFLESFSEKRIILISKDKFIDDYKDMIISSRDKIIENSCVKNSYYFKRNGKTLSFYNSIMLGRNMFYLNKEIFKKHNDFLDLIKIDGEVLSKWYPTEDIMGELVENQILKGLSKFDLI